VGRVLLLGAGLAFGIWTLFPLYWMLRTSLMSDNASTALPLAYLPIPLSFEHWLHAWQKLNLGGMIANSLLVSLSACTIALMLAFLAAYALARFAFRLKPIILVMLAATQMVPIVLIIVPTFVVITRLGAANSLFGLIAVEGLLAVPFSVLMLKQFYDQIPPDIDEAAMIDGCTRLGVLRHVIIPLSLPGLVAITVFNFINSWNELLMATVLLSDPALFTLPLGLVITKDAEVFSWGAHAVGALVAVAPTLVIFAFIQRWMIAGMAAGATKG
jgi:multiple sugar transport system permease protein